MKAESTVVSMQKVSNAGKNTCVRDGEAAMKILRGER